jgi:DNA-binding CsgD family transcriptional regulator
VTNVLDTSPYAVPEYRLSNRESQIVSLIAEGYQDKEIAAELGITLNTVLNTLHNLRIKTGKLSRPALAVWYYRNLYRKIQAGDVSPDVLTEKFCRVEQRWQKEAINGGTDRRSDGSFCP